FMKNFIGKDGVITSAMSRFIRPNSVKDFTIRDMEFSKDEIQEEMVKDRLGRTWRRNIVKVFEVSHLLTYCLDMPEGAYCIGRVLNISNQYLLGIIEGNFRKYILSHLLINPYFWEKEALAQYLKTENGKTSPLMNGVDYSIESGVLKGSISKFPFRFEIPKAKDIESVRLQTGLYKNKDKSYWTGYGMEWVQRGKEKDMVCGAGLEAFNTQSTYILNFLRDRRKQEKLRKIKGEDAKPLPGIWYKPFRGLKSPFQIYGYCAPLEEDPRVADQYFVDFKNAKPLKYKYKISQ
ncbi:MAG: hypothetical protein AAF203_05130, partial [Pseudomonadota bacterium]